MCFVWISEQIAIISLYNINWLVFKTEKYPFKGTWLLYVTCSNSKFYPHGVFMCFVLISEQTAIISLYSINWLIFITETECAYCAVRTGFVSSNLIVLFKALICWSFNGHSVYCDMRTRILYLCYMQSLFFTTETRVRSQVSPFMAWKVVLGQGFLRVLRFTPHSIIPPLLHTHLPLHAACTVINWVGAGGNTLQYFFYLVVFFWGGAYWIDEGQKLRKQKYVQNDYSDGLKTEKN